MQGTYALVAHLPESRKIMIGSRGNEFPKGYYVYVGSALSGLEKRIGRHMSSSKTKHWHIDYFLEHAKILDVRTIVSGERYECLVSRTVRQLADSEPMDGFGSSDCRCNTHLYYFSENPLGNGAFMKLFP